MKTFNPWSLVPKETQAIVLRVLKDEPDYHKATMIREIILSNPGFKDALDKVPLDPGYFAYALIHTYNLTKAQ